MEKLQLCLDDDDYDFPTCNANTGLDAGSYPTERERDTTTEQSDNVFKLAASAHNELDLPLHSHDQYTLFNHSWSKQKATCAFEDTSVEFPCNGRDDIIGDQAGSRVDTTSSFQTSTKLSVQDVTKTKSSEAQNVFLASMLQAQLCLLELQDEIEKQESIPEMHVSESKNPELCINSFVEKAGQQMEDDVLEESPENEEAFYSDGEMEDEHLFCDNPIFNDVSSSYPTIDEEETPLQQIGCNNITATYLLHSNNKGDQKTIISNDQTALVQIGMTALDQPDALVQIGMTALDQPNALVQTDIWNKAAGGQDTIYGHEIQHSESLEILQIFENDWEEKEALSSRLRAPKWPIYDNLPCTDENINQPQDGTCSSALRMAENNPSVDISSESEGLLFCSSSSSLVNTLLVEPDSLQHDCHSHMCVNKPSNSPIQIEVQEEEGTCQDVTDPEPLCSGCQVKLSSITLVLEENVEELMHVQQKDFPEIVIEIDKQPASGSDEVMYVETAPNRDAARCLAMKLFHLSGFQRSQVAPYLQKNNDFSSMVAEEYLSLFDFTGKTLDVALRSLLQELVLTGETQERERVLFHFAKRFHSSNPKDFRSANEVHTLTCALMLLNSDLHGQNIGKPMSLQEFIINLDGMNDGDSFPRDLLKGLYHSIRNEKLEWAVSEEKLSNSLISKPENLLNRKKSNSFVDIPCVDPNAPIYRQGMLCRKVHADIDGKKTPWGKRGWKSFYTVLKGMVMFFLKDEYRSDIQCPEEVISVHHALAERASEYTKRPHVFRLQTADWRVFLFQAQNSEEMNSWIARINLVAAMFSAPPFPAAIGSQKRFVRPILPSSPCKLGLEEQLQSHETLMDTFTDDLTEHQRNLPDSKSKARDWEDYHLREEYLRFEKSRYEMYVKLLALRMQKGCEDLNTFESLISEPDVDQNDGCGLKRSHSSPSLVPEGSPMGIKVKRNISERRTYRRIIPKRNKNVV
ncbi:PH and SEC7 domain-containing protein 4-like [Pelobates fuscus]|uniref:PH and SEC7 domain-containing protein 4-like n=1 Tax=Pelobates fuscus TaxID=191477 RepID=UPI002FE4A9AE